jgi:SAM-dependent methyltransferase
VKKNAKSGLYITVPDENTGKKQRKYAAMCRDRDVLELGGVMGTFIDLCNEAGAKSVTSIDREPQDKRVIKADILEYLESTKKKFDAVYARHMLEHFPPESVQAIMKNTYKCLRTAGIIIIVVPNLNNLAVATTEFWREFEHVRPYSAKGISQNLERIGFKIVKISPDEDSWDSNPMKKIVRAIRSVIVGIPYEAPDVYVVAEKQ